MREAVKYVDEKLAIKVKPIAWAKIEQPSDTASKVM